MKKIMLSLLVVLFSFELAFSQTVQDEKNDWMKIQFGHFKNSAIFEQRVSMGEVVGSGVIRIGVVSLFVELDKTTPKVERFLALEIENSGKTSSTYLTNGEARTLLNCIVRIADVIKNPPVRSSNPVSYWANPKDNISVGIVHTDGKIIPAILVGKVNPSSSLLELKQIEVLYTSLANSINFLTQLQQNDIK